MNMLLKIKQININFMHPNAIFCIIYIDTDS